MTNTTRAIAITAIGSMVAPAIAIITAPILANELGVDGRGELAAATAPLIVLTSVAAAGIPEAITHYVARRKLTFRKALGYAAIVFIATTVIAQLAVSFLSSVLAGGAADLAQMMSLATLALLPSLLLGVLRAYAMGRGSWSLVTAERILGSVLKLSSIVLAAGAGLLDVPVAVAIVALTNFAGMIAYIPLIWAPRGSVHDDFATMSHLYSFAGRYWAGTLTGVLVSRIDQIFITPLSDVEQLGLYVVAVTISEVPLVFNSAVREVIYAQHSRDSNSDRLALASRTSTVVTFIAAIGVGGIAAVLLEPLFGRGFGAALLPLIILLAGVVLGNAGSVAGMGLSAVGRPGLRSISLTVALATNIVFLIILVPPLGAVGAAIATLTANATAAAMNIMFCRRHLAVRATDLVGFRISDANALFTAASAALRRTTVKD